MEKYPEDVQLEHVNSLLELLITLNEYEEALELLCKKCHTKFDTKVPATELSQMTHEEQLKAFEGVRYGFI